MRLKCNCGWTDNRQFDKGLKEGLWMQSDSNSLQPAGSGDICFWRWNEIILRIGNEVYDILRAFKLKLLTGTHISITSYVQGKLMHNKIIIMFIK